MVFPAFFNLSLYFAIRSSWSEPQSASGLIFANCIELPHLWLQRCKIIQELVMVQGSLVYCSPWGCKESDTTEWLNWTEYWCKMISLLSVLTIWWCLCVKSSLVLLEVVCYDQGVLLAKLLAFSLLHFVLQCQTCLLFQLSLNFLLLHSSLLWWKGHLFFFGVSSRRSCRSSENRSTWDSSASKVGAQTWITVLNALPWKQIKIILSLLKLYPDTVFQTLWLTMGATPFLLRVSCPQ